MTTSGTPTTDNEETQADLQTPKVLTADNVGEVIAKLGGLSVKRLDGTVGASEEGMFTILYGQAGAGKTTLAAGAIESPDFGMPYLHVDAEGGIDAIIDRAGVEYVSVYTWQQFENITKELIAKEGAGYKTICVDNLAEIYNMSLVKIAGKTDAPEIQEWGEAFREVRHKIREYRDLARKYGINVIFCCWDADEKDDRGVMKKDLALSPSLRKQVPGLTTIIGHIAVLDDPNMRLLSFASGPKTVAKFRRSQTAAAQKIPLQIRYNVKQLPMAAIINTLKGGAAWPSTWNAPAQPNR